MRGRRCSAAPVARRAGVVAVHYGEKIAVALDANPTETAFIHSSSHSINILDRDYTRIGIGVLKDGLTVMFAQDCASQ